MKFEDLPKWKQDEIKADYASRPYTIGKFTVCADPEWSDFPQVSISEKLVHWAKVFVMGCKKKRKKPK